MPGFRKRKDDDDKRVYYKSLFPLKWQRPLKEKIKIAILFGFVQEISIITLHFCSVIW
jgi:hypothetical protein